MVTTRLKVTEPDGLCFRCEGVVKTTDETWNRLPTVADSSLLHKKGLVSSVVDGGLITG